MDNEIYVIYDAAKNVYGTLLCYPNDATAMRDLNNEYRKEGSLFNTHPQDFILYKIGSYAPLTGELIAYQTIERICSCADFIERG